MWKGGPFDVCDLHSWKQQGSTAYRDSFELSIPLIMGKTLRSRPSEEELGWCLLHMHLLSKPSDSGALKFPFSLQERCSFVHCGILISNSWKPVTWRKLTQWAVYLLIPLFSARSNCKILLEILSGGDEKNLALSVMSTDFWNPLGIRKLCRLPQKVQPKTWHCTYFMMYIKP